MSNQLIITRCNECYEWLPSKTLGCWSYCTKEKKIVSEIAENHEIPDWCPKLPKNKMLNCEVREFCKIKQCEDSNNRWINPSNCTCRGCLGRSEDKNCEWSGEAYNTDGECLMSK